MKTKRKPANGEELWLVYQPFRPSRATCEDLPEGKLVTVDKVGRTYFYIGRIKFRISDWCEETEYSSAFSLYENEQEWRDEQEVCAWKKKLCHYFMYRTWELDVNKCRKVGEVLGVTIGDA